MAHPRDKREKLCTTKYTAWETKVKPDYAEIGTSGRISVKRRSSLTLGFVIRSRLIRSFDHLVGACEQHRFVSLTRSSMLLDCLAIAVSVLLSAGIRNAWAITLGSSPAQGRLVASYLTELVLQIAHLHPNVPGWENGRI
jgi:hypothetical protein